MLFAVEGGGFFSSSASGYSKGLTLLLLGQKNEEKPMRVTPWNQYQLVDQEGEPYLQLASGKKRPVCGCASFSCFGRASTELESPSSPKVQLSRNQENLTKHPAFDEKQEAKDSVDCVVDDDDDGDDGKMVNLKSSLKKASISSCLDGGKNNQCENDNDVACQKERRSVQWTDTNGGELYEIREFEMSEDELDNNFVYGNERSCSCRIM